MLIVRMLCNSLDGIINFAMCPILSYLMMCRSNCGVNAKSSEKHKRSVAMVDQNIFCTLLSRRK
jgi:hypothetical protein